MNELIEELAKQCYVKTGSEHTDHFAYWKFAELILTEVISTIYRSDISDKKQEKLVDELGYKFGMK